MRHQASWMASCLSIVFVTGLVAILLTETLTDSPQERYDLQHCWCYSLNNKATVPFSLPCHIEESYEEGDVVDLYTTLPSTPIKQPYLSTKIFLQHVKIYLEDELIYEYAGDLTPNGLFKLGSGILMVPLPSDYAFKTLHIQYIYKFNDITNYIYPVALTSESPKDIILSEHSETLHLNLWLFIGGLTCLVIGLIQYLLQGTSKGLFYIGLFASNSALWFLCNSKCLQLFTNNLRLIHCMEYITFYFLCIPLWLFFYVQVNEKFFKRLCLNVLIPNILFFVLANLLNDLNIADYFELLVYYYIILFINFIFLVLITGLLTLKKHTLGKNLFIGLLALMISVFLEFVKFDVTNIKVHLFFNYGIALFFISLIYYVCHIQTTSTATQKRPRIKAL